MSEDVLKNSMRKWWATKTPDEKVKIKAIIENRRNENDRLTK